MTIWPIDAIYRVSLKPEVIKIPQQELETSDGAKVKVSAHITLRVEDATRALSAVQNYKYAVAEISRIRLAESVCSNRAGFVLDDAEQFGKELSQGLREEIQKWGITIQDTRVKASEVFG